MSLHMRLCNMREINACYAHLNAHISNEFRLGAFDFVITKYVSIFLKIKDETKYSSKGFKLSLPMGDFPFCKIVRGLLVLLDSETRVIF